MNRIESRLTTAFIKWLKTHYDSSAIFEIKVTKTKSLPFSVVKPHQVLALELARHKKLIYKISDIDRLTQKPADIICFVKSKAYVVIFYYKRSKKDFVMILINNFIKEKKESIRKSLTEDRAKEIGVTYFL